MSIGGFRNVDRKPAAIKVPSDATGFVVKNGQSQIYNENVKQDGESLSQVDDGRTGEATKSHSELYGRSSGICLRDPVDFCEPRCEDSGSVFESDQEGFPVQV